MKLTLLQVIKLNAEEIDSLTETQVIQRWTCLFKGLLLIHKMQNGDVFSSAELAAIGDITEICRKRLTSLSWFMKCLNETIARQTNKEDGCTGHFWEVRYNSQALLTEEALIQKIVSRQYSVPVPHLIFCSFLRPMDKIISLKASSSNTRK